MSLDESCKHYDIVDNNNNIIAFGLTKKNASVIIKSINTCCNISDIADDFKLYNGQKIKIISYNEIG